jgi:hypothetical protein
MAHFFRPPSSPPDGYDVDGRLAPDSVFRIWIPLPGDREIGLWGGGDLWVRSSNEGIIRNDGSGIARRQDQDPFLTFLKLSPVSAGNCQLQAGMGQSIWITLEVNAGTARADGNLNLATQRGSYENIDATAATHNFRSGKAGIELLGGLSRGYMRWLEIVPGMIRETSGPPPGGKAISASTVWTTYSERPKLVVVRQGWTIQLPGTEQLRDFYLEVWWLTADDTEYQVLDGHARRAGYGDQLSFSLIMRPWCGDLALTNQMLREFAESLGALAGMLIVASAWRMSVTMRMAGGNQGPPSGPPPPPVPAKDGKVVVTEQMIRDSVKGAPLKTQQKGGVSIPRIQEYVDRLNKGEQPPSIKVDDGIIVDGNHRYIAGRIAGKECPNQPWAGGNPNRVIPWEDLKIDPNPWQDGNK